MKTRVACRLSRLGERLSKRSERRRQSVSDPFKKAVGRHMHTSKKRDPQGEYYDVSVSGGGGDAPVEQGSDAPPTVLDPESDYGPPLPPGSVGYGDEEGPIPPDDGTEGMSGDGDEMGMMHPMGGMGPMMAQNDVDPTLLQRVIQWLRSGGGQPEGRDVSEGLNEALPRELSGRDAVLKRRERLKKMDEQTKEG
jgi:hypothetical protein